MSKTAMSIRVYSYYLFLMGSLITIIPNTVITVLGFPETSEVWIRILGIFTCTTGIYYFHSSKHEQKEFFKSTIGGRIFFFVITTILTVVLHLHPMLIMLGSIDLMGAFWTFSTIQNKK